MVMTERTLTSRTHCLSLGGIEGTFLRTLGATTDLTKLDSCTNKTITNCRTTTDVKIQLTTEPFLTGFNDTSLLKSRNATTEPF